MRLLRLEIQEFGRLEGMTLSFGAGMNLIEGENESGKSTLLAALRFLLYGFPRRNSAEGEERDRRLSYRTRRAAGSLLLEAGGKEYRIYRAVSLHGSAGSEQAGEELAVTALPEGSPVPLGGKTPGEVLLGLPARLFDSSLCVRQSEIDRVSSADVGDCVSDLLGAGGEGAARSAGRLLETARRRLLHAKGRGGRIAELEDEEAELSERLRQARACAEELKGLRQRERELCTALAAGREQASALQARLGEHRLLRELEEREELRRLEAEAQSYQAALDRAPLPPLGEEDAARLSSLLHKKRGSEERVARLTATRTTALQENNNSVKKTPPRGAMSGQSTGASSALGRLLLTAGLLLLVAAVLLLCLAPVLPEKRSSLLIRSAFSSVIGALLLLVRHLWCSKGTPTAQEPANGDFDEALSAAREEDLRLAAALREMLLQALGSSADTAEEGERLLQDAWRREGEARAARLAASEGLSRAEERIRALRARLSPLGEEALRAQLAELRTQNTGVTSPLTRGEYASCEGTAGRNTPEQEPPPTAWEGELAALTASITARSDELADLRNAMLPLATAAEEAEALTGRLTALREELGAARARYQAILLAGEALASASEELRREIAPRLRARASELLCTLTEGAHRELYLDRELAISMEEGGTPRPLSAFSAGCQDAACLSLRLALPELITSEPMPLLLDEALARLDDRRAESLLAQLLTLCREGRQCLLLTCHSREGRLLERLEADADTATTKAPPSRHFVLLADGACTQLLARK